MEKMKYDENARILKAIAHPTRLQIVEMIRTMQPCVKNMEEHLGLAQSNISQHLSILRNIGIVEAERDGNQVCYHIKNKLVSKVLDVLDEKTTSHNRRQKR